MNVGLDRRTFLRAGSIAALGLHLPGLLWSQKTAQAAGRAKAEGSRAKHCILLYATGGPAQHETFDPKPEAVAEVRGEFGPIPTSVPGIRVCELMPRMAQNAHRYAILRSTWHNVPIHGIGTHLNLTGRRPMPRFTAGEPKPSRMDPPSLSGVIRQLHGDRNGLPGSVQLPARIGDQNTFQWAGQHAGLLGPRYDPLMLIDENWTPGTLPPVYVPDRDMGRERRADRFRLLQQVEAQEAVLHAPPSDAYSLHRDRARDLLSSQSAWKAFILDEEKPATRERYGNTRFGRSCLVARRLIEAGVGLVTVTWMPDPPTPFHSEANFDTHNHHFKKMKDLLLPPVDRAFAALLEDLDERGLLGETLVVWTGEFGRTPKINANAGRDHWGNVYSTVLAGGGVRGGQVYGASDRNGAEPADRPVHVSAFIATIYEALGYSPDTVVYGMDGRPHQISEGRVLTELFS
jgi:hypothetical protein